MKYVHIKTSKAKLIIANDVGSPPQKVSGHPSLVNFLPKCLVIYLIVSSK